MISFALVTSGTRKPHEEKERDKRMSERASKYEDDVNIWRNKRYFLYAEMATTYITRY